MTHRPGHVLPTRRSERIPLPTVAPLVTTPTIPQREASPDITSNILRIDPSTGLLDETQRQELIQRIGQTMSPDTARDLADAGLLFDPETGQPWIPLRPEIVQALGGRGKGVARARSTALGLLTGPGEISAGLVSSRFRLGEDAAITQRAQELRESGVGTLEAAQRAFIENRDSLNFTIPQTAMIALTGPSAQEAEVPGGLILEVITDPLLPLIQPLKIARGGVAIINSTARKQAINGFVRDVNVVVRSLSPQELALYKEAGMDAPQLGNQFVIGHLPIEDYIASVKTGNDPITSLIVAKLGINPSALADDPIKQTIIGVARMRISSEQLIETALTVAVDTHARRFSGRLTDLFMDSEGIVKGTDKFWETVFSRPDEFADIMTPEFRSLIDDYLRVIDEAEQLRRVYGLDPLPTRNADGWFYVPRQAKGKGDVDFLRPSNARLRRVFEEAEVGIEAGIRYENDIRAVLQIHLRRSYREIENAELARILEPFSFTAKELVPRNIVAAAVEAAQNLAQVQRLVRRERQLVIKSRQVARDSVSAAEQRLNDAQNRLSTALGERRGRRAQQFFDEQREVIKQAQPATESLRTMLQIFTRNPTRQRELALPSEVNEVLNRLVEAEVTRSGLGRISVKIQIISDIIDPISPGRLARGVSPEDLRIIRGTEPVTLPLPSRGRVRDSKRIRALRAEVTTALKFLDDIIAAAGELPRVTRASGKLPAVTARLQTQLDEAIEAYRIAKQAYTREIEALRVSGQTILDSTRMESMLTRRMPNLSENVRKQLAEMSDVYGQAGNNISLTKWRNRFFPQEDARALTKALGEFGRPVGTNKILRFAQEFVNTVRIPAASIDFALQFIQGQGVLASKPQFWPRIIWDNVWGTLDPTAYARLVKNNIGTFQEMARYGVPVGDTEFFVALKSGEGLSAGALLELVPQIGTHARNAARMAGKQTFGRFAQGYNAALGTARMLLWDSMRSPWVRSGGTLEELGAHIRNLTGGLDSTALGVGPTQRVIESVFMAFSPRLLRSTMALFGDVMQAFATPIAGVARAGLRREFPQPIDVIPTVRQRMAVKNLAMLAAALNSTYVVAMVGMGKSKEEIMTGLNPLSGKKFLSVQVNGDWIGWGGQFRAITQFIAKSLVTLGKGEPENFIKADSFDNPVLAFQLSRGAIGTSTALAGVEAFTGLDVMPFDTIDGLPDLLKHLGTAYLPFAIQGLIEGEKALSTAISAVGPRTSPQTKTEERDFLRQEQARELFDQDYSELDLEEVREVHAVTEVADAIKAVMEQRTERNDTYQTYLNRRTDIIDDIGRRTEALGVRLNTFNPNGDVTGREYRLRLGELQSERAAKLDQLDKTSFEALEIQNEFQPEERHFFEVLARYLNVVNDPTLVDAVTGDYDFDLRDINLNKLRNDVGVSIIENIERQLRGGFDTVERQLRDDQDVIREYLGKTFEIMRTKGVETAYQRYLNEPNAFAQDILEVNENVILYKMMADAIKTAMRLNLESGPDLERRLLRWGYISKPINPVVLREQLEELPKALSR